MGEAVLETGQPTQKQLTLRHLRSRLAFGSMSSFRQTDPGLAAIVRTCIPKQADDLFEIGVQGQPQIYRKMLS